MIDPVEALMKTSSLLVPIPTASATASHVAPIPTVKPDMPIIMQAGKTGDNTLWVVFVLMLLSTIAFAVMAYRTPVQKRLFHILAAFITTFATISYYSMACGDGASMITTIIKETHKHVPTTHTIYIREVFWARYVDWALTTPLLLLDLSLLAGLSGANILVAIVADLVMVLTGLFAALGNKDSQSWGYYAMGCVAYLVIIYLLAVPGRRSALKKEPSAKKFTAAISIFTLVIWTVYPVIWALGEGSRRISVDAEIIAYAVLDILAKPVFGAWLLITHSKVPATQHSIDGVWSRGIGAIEGSLRVGDDDEEA